MEFICNYNIEADIFWFYSSDLDRNFTCDSEGNKKGMGIRSMWFEHSDDPENCEDISEAAFLAANDFFSKLLAEQEASNLMTAWALH